MTASREPQRGGLSGRGSRESPEADISERFRSATLTDTIAVTQNWISRPTPRPAARLRLICLPFAGGGAAAYRPWLKHLPSDIEMCLVQLPGRETRMRETPYTRLDELVTDLVPALEPFLDRPYALFGHSMGALTAYELTRRLKQDPRTSAVPVLAVTGYAAFAADPSRAQRAGCDAVLEKPCSPEDLEAAIRNLIAGPR